MNTIEAYADVTRACNPALSDEHVEALLHTTPWEDDRANYGTDNDVLMKISKSETRYFITEEFDRILAKRTLAEFQGQVEAALFNMLDLANIASSNGSETHFARFIATIKNNLSAVGVQKTSCLFALKDGRIQICQ